MDITHQSPHQITRTHDFAVHYGQSDVDTIREQIEQTEAMKRRWLFLAMIISIAALVGAIVLLSTNYALYSSSESDKKKLAQENAALKSRADQTQQQLDTTNARMQNSQRLAPTLSRSCRSYCLRFFGATEPG